jgi:hypothetical protein
MELVVHGTVKRRRRSTLTVMVTNFETGGGIPRATVRISGAGIRRRSVRTDVLGNARVAVRPARRGYLVISASKRGYRGATLRIRVR